MRILRNSNVKIALLFVVTAGLSISCSASRVARESPALEQAIVLFIDGKYTEAESSLLAVIPTLTSNEEFGTAYLYLGRTYMAMEKYEEAAVSFRQGLGYGADPRLDEYLKLATEYYTGEEHIIRRVPVITRGQLASLIAMTLELKESDDAIETPPDVESHWCEPYVHAVQVAGIMDTLPDGNFYPDASVTWSAFYSVVHRAALATDVSEELWMELFPGGLEAVVREKMTDDEDGTSRAMVSGPEAAAILERLSGGAGS